MAIGFWLLVYADSKLPASARLIIFPNLEFNPCFLMDRIEAFC